MERVYNFSPGPSMLAQPVLEKAQKDLMVYGNTGMSVMEMSHRSKMYTDIFDKTVADLRALMHIGDDYEVLLLQGGATLQFSAIPLNLMVKGKASIQAISRTLPQKKQSATAKSISPRPAAKTTTPTFPTWRRRSSTPTRITFTSPRTTPSTARGLWNCRMSKRPLLPTQAP